MFYGNDMKLMKIVLSSLALSVLVSCTSPTDRMAQCTAQGISKDTCYLAEQNRQSAITAAAEKQALENAREANQITPTAYKAHTYSLEGINLEVRSDGSAYIDGKPAALDEQEATAKVYSQGLNQFIVYSSGKVAMMKDRKFVGYMVKK